MPNHKTDMLIRIFVAIKKRKKRTNKEPKWKSRKNGDLYLLPNVNLMTFFLERMKIGF